MRPINLELRSHLESNRDACGRETRWLVDGRARKAVICVSGKPASIRHDRHMCPAAVDTYRPKVCQQRQNHGHMPPEECDQFPTSASTAGALLRNERRDVVPDTPYKSPVGGPFSGQPPTVPVIP